MSEQLLLPLLHHPAQPAGGNGWKHVCVCVRETHTHTHTASERMREGESGHLCICMYKCAGLPSMSKKEMRDLCCSENVSEDNEVKKRTE